ncbi:hypothetical protein BH09PAT1_BH09PAT1_1420 [soil metagenome]
MRVTPTRSYIRNTKAGKQLVVPAKQTFAKLRKKQNEQVKEKDTKNEPESRIT